MYEYKGVNVTWIKKTSGKCTLNDKKHEEEIKKIIDKRVKNK